MILDKNNFHFDLPILLNKFNISLCNYLEQILPTLFDDWWKKAVLDNLSYQQKQYTEKRNIHNLQSFDLAALLRILDANWYHISQKMGLSREARHFVKEMQSIRNRWAHASAEGVHTEDIYRDLDTMKRLAIVIEADQNLINEINNAKYKYLDKQFREQDSEPKDAGHHSEFSPGHIVILKSNPDKKGAIVSISKASPEDRIMVFLDGKVQTFYASQLSLEHEEENVHQFLSIDHFHAYLTALQIENPSLSNLYSLNAARIDFIPYQFRPVMKFIRSDRPRILIADGVGVGKTIEAGLILRELQARRDINSVLIICPRPLVAERKWQIEMKRFEEQFTHLDGKTLRYCINEMDLDGSWPEQYNKVIIPYSLFDETLIYGSDKKSKKKRKLGLIDLDPPPRFDLVIVDEAHHIRNTNTYSHKAVRFFCDHAEAVVFLTATPIQLGNNDLFVLLNILRPDLIIDPGSFEHMTGPNPFINKAVEIIRNQEHQWAINAAQAIENASNTPWGQSILKNNPVFNQIYNSLKRGSIGPDERIKLISDIEALHTFSGIINRTRRRDIGNFTIRKPETVNVELSHSQKRLHDELLNIQKDVFLQLHRDNNVKFMMTTIRRQAASCIYGLVPFLEDIVTRHIDELTLDEYNDDDILGRFENIDSIQSRIQNIIQQAKLLDPHDPKLVALIKIIKEKQELANNKIMLFSSFRHTLNYIRSNLDLLDIRVGLVHGGTPDEERNDLRNRFELNRDEEDAIDVMLFSEVGCEGLDYQFCDCIVNYDLPWNPMRIEQRIGRIDRNGQKSESVAIINLITPGTVDADIYERCLIRIGVFDQALGGSEEILGKISREIRDIAENYNLSDDERKIKLQQIADNEIRLIQEQEALEQKQLELFGIRLPRDQIQEEIDEASSYWLGPNSLFRLVTLYLKNACGNEQEYILGDKPIKSLRLSQDARSIILRDFQTLPRKNTLIYREWDKWLKGVNPHLLITFESESASHNSKAVFITPIHPLIKQAARSFRTKNRIKTKLIVKTSLVPSGKYQFAIYHWKVLGIREDIVVKTLASSKLVSDQLINILKNASSGSIDSSNMIDSTILDDLDSQHYTMWTDARKKHREQTYEIVDYRRESLIVSHRARISLLREQLENADNDKIKRMRQAQIDNAEADFARRTQELDIAIEKADIITEPVAYGILIVEDEK